MLMVLQSGAHKFALHSVDISFYSIPTKDGERKVVGIAHNPIGERLISFIAPENLPDPEEIKVLDQEYKSDEWTIIASTFVKYDYKSGEEIRKDILCHVSVARKMGVEDLELLHADYVGGIIYEEE